MYTFEPKEKFVKAFGRNLNISRKNAKALCDVIRGKKLKTVERLFNDMVAKRRSLEGKYYTKTVKVMQELLESCKKNAEYMGLDSNKLFVHASSHQGTIINRRRRKADFGSRIKYANVELMLIEKGRGKK